MSDFLTYYARRCVIIFFPLFSGLSVDADVIYSSLRNLSIPMNFDGIFLDIESGAIDGSDWDLNLFFGGLGVTNSTGFQPVREVDAGDGTLSNLSFGTKVDALLTFDSSIGPGGSIDHLGSTFTAGEVGYLGYQLSSGNYGWMRLVMDTGGDALVKDWAYENSGGSITVGKNVVQDGSTVTLDSSDGSFTLGSALSGDENLVKTGSGATTLDVSNTNTGTTTVSSGMLIVNGDNSEATGEVTVDSGGALGGSGIIGGSTTILAGGSLEAGTSPGILTFSNDLTLTSGSETVMEIFGTVRGDEYDGIDVGGLLTYGGDLIISASTSIAHGTYDLFAMTSETGDFESITLSGAAYTNDAFTASGDIWTATVGADTYTFSQLTGDLTVVPESRAYALLAGIATLAHVLLRRRYTTMDTEARRS